MSEGRQTPLYTYAKNLTKTNAGAHQVTVLQCSGLKTRSIGLALQQTQLVIRIREQKFGTSGWSPQQDTSPSNEHAPKNMSVILVTCTVCHVDKSLVKEDAPQNITLILVTCPVCHADKSLVKEDAPENMRLISVTCPVCHADKSLVKEDAR